MLIIVSIFCSYEIKHIVGAFNRITSKFIIKRVAKEDYGVYICKANNAKGSRELKISLEGECCIIIFPLNIL